MSCNCTESRKPEKTRDWFILEHKRNRGFFVKRFQEASKFSTLKCGKCGHKWRALDVKHYKKVKHYGTTG